jgi:hypothetical protein
MRRALLVILLGALVSAAAASAASNEGAGAFMTRILREEIHGQWALQWSQLHPGHQRLITKAQYVQCSRVMKTDFATGQEVFRVLSVRDEKIAVEGVPQRMSKRVTINFREPGKEGLTYRVHAVSVGGRWTWILGGRFLSALSHRQCLDGSPLRSR